MVGSEISRTLEYMYIFRVHVVKNDTLLKVLSPARLKSDAISPMIDIVKFWLNLCNQVEGI